MDTVDQHKSVFLKISHQIHDYPELGNQEYRSSELLANTLQDFGFIVERNFAGLETAFCARKSNGNGPRVAFLAEYDALPDLGHGCGHNIIGTASTAAGIALGVVLEDIQGEVWVIGTPAEETEGTKAGMVNQGVFKNVDAALMIHPHEGNYMLPQSLAMDAFKVSFFGKPSHAAAAPWEGINALDAILLTFNNVNALRQQIRPEARVHGVITQGGSAPNIIPEYTEGRFYVRATTRLYLDQLVEQFLNCARSAAQATGCQVEIEKYENCYDEMIHNLPLATRFKDYMVKVLGSASFQRSPDSFGSVDMGNVSHVVPAIHALVDIADGKVLHPHTHEFCQAAETPFADIAMLRSAKGLALCGYDLLTDPRFLRKVRQDFKKSLG